MYHGVAVSWSGLRNKKQVAFALLRAEQRHALKTSEDVSRAFAVLAKKDGAWDADAINGARAVGRIGSTVSWTAGHLLVLCLSIIRNVARPLREQMVKVMYTPIVECCEADLVQQSSASDLLSLQSMHKALRYSGTCIAERVVDALDNRELPRWRVLWLLFNISFLPDSNSSLRRKVASVIFEVANDAEDLCPRDVADMVALCARVGLHDGDVVLSLTERLTDEVLGALGIGHLIRVVWGIGVCFKRRPEEGRALLRAPMAALARRELTAEHLAHCLQACVSCGGHVTDELCEHILAELERIGGFRALSASELSWTVTGLAAIARARNDATRPRGEVGGVRKLIHRSVPYILRHASVGSFSGSQLVRLTAALARSREHAAAAAVAAELVQRQLWWKCVTGAQLAIVATAVAHAPPPADRPSLPSPPPGGARAVAGSLSSGFAIRAGELCEAGEWRSAKPAVSVFAALCAQYVQAVKARPPAQRQPKPYLTAVFLKEFAQHVVSLPCQPAFRGEMQRLLAMSSASVGFDSAFIKRLLATAPNSSQA
ncbi:hypothetical protein DIPPA_01463 [Diplonema papillatum]|nr:hypothetical protein DIPPA_01463 [Diplonema papillatum]